jgi:predicted AAA+ superfamily ATPase
MADLYKKTGRKYYFLDVGFMNLIDRENFGQRFESIVFLELSHHFNTLSYIIHTPEVDFITQEGNTAVQVCFELTFENIEREIKSLRKIDTDTKYVVYFQKN